MKTRIIGILVCMLLIANVLQKPVVFLSMNCILFLRGSIRLRNEGDLFIIEVEYSSAMEACSLEFDTNND